MFFLAVIGAPLLRSIEPPALRQRIFREMGLRFRTAGWIAISILLITGVLNLYFPGWLQWNLARANSVLGIVIVIAAVRLARGG